MAARVRNRDISPLELVKAHLDRIERVNPAINAFTAVMAEQAVARARACEESPYSPCTVFPSPSRIASMSAASRH